VEDPSLIAAICKAVLPAEEIDERVIARRVLLDPNFTAEASFLARWEGRPVGYCWAVVRRKPLENGPDDSDRGYIVLLGVVPGERRRGVGEVLLQTAEEWLRGQGCTSCWISPYAPGYFTPGVDEAAYPEGLRFLLKRGYETSSRPLAMQLDLADLRMPCSRAGVRFSSFEPGLTAPLIKFAEEEFAGDWVRFARDAARDILRGDDPNRLQIALHDDKIVGYAHFEGSRFGPIGVAKTVEGKGVGSSLMGRTLEAMRAAGQHRAWFMWTDDRTADRFYRPWGWQEWRRFSVLSKPL